MKTHITLRIDADVLQSAMKLATAEKRTMAGMIELLLVEAIGRRMQGDYRWGDSAAETSHMEVPQGSGKDYAMWEGTRVRKSDVGAFDAPKRRMCKRHPALGMYEDECTGTSCRQERAERERRML